MLMRCYNPRSSQYHNYGARGIVVCSDWLANPLTFVEWGIQTGFSPELTLERRDVNGPYSPDNCCFATKRAQARNKRNNLLIEWRGETKCLAEWCELLGCDVRTVSARLKRGMAVDEAFGPVAAASKPVSLTVNGKTRTAEEWAARAGVSVSTIYRRLRDGKPINAKRGPSGPKAGITVYRVKPGPKPRHYADSPGRAISGMPTGTRGAL